MNLPIRSARFRSAAAISLLLLAPACSNSRSNASQANLAPRFTVNPVLTVNPNGSTPLAAEIELATTTPVRVSLFIEDGFRSVLVPDAGPQLATHHRVPVLGLYPNRTNRITVIATNQLGRQSSSKPLTFVTPPLPVDFPPIVVDRAEPENMEPGFTLMEPLVRPGPGGPPSDYTIAVDPMGQVVWYSEGLRGSTWTRGSTRLVPNSDRVTQREVDMVGNELQLWYADQHVGPAGAPAGALRIATDSIHHEFMESPEGADSDYVFLSTEMRELADYPADEDDLTVTEASANVVGDVIVEIKRDGTIVREKRLIDIIDPYRIGYEGLRTQFWNAFYGTSTRDWTHANSVMIDTRDDTYIISLRHQDAIVKLRRDTPGTGSPDDVVWILGDHFGWNAPWDAKLLEPIPVGAGPLEFEWQYHQHAARINFEGDLICYDNGNYRAMPPNPYETDESLWYSRAVEYRIDPAAMTVQQLWAAGGLYDTEPNRLGPSLFVSIAARHELTGNVLTCSGGLRDFTTGRTFTRVLEVTHDDPPVEVFDLTIKDPAETGDWITYRSHRIPSLYPNGVVASEPRLHVGPARLGQTVTIQVTGVTPGAKVVVALDKQTPSELSRFANREITELPQPELIVGTALADRTGVAVIESDPIPEATSGAYAFQAVVLKGDSTSNVVTAFVQP